MALCCAGAALLGPWGCTGVGAPGQGCPWEGKCLGWDAHGKRCWWEGMSLGWDDHGKGCAQEGTSQGRDTPGGDAHGSLPSQGGSAPPVTHRPLSQGRRHTARVHGHAEDPTAPILQGQALGEHVQRSLGAQPPPSRGGTATGGRQNATGGDPQIPPHCLGSGTLLQR